MSSKDVVSEPDIASARSHWVWPVILAFLVFAVFATAQLSVGALYVVEYSADNAYVMDLAARIKLGQVPHVDFGLHLGALPFYLISLSDAFLPGQAFMVAQSVFVAICLVLAVWVVRTRLRAVSGIVLMLAIVFHGMAITGPATPEVSMVVFYNRWAWIVAYLFLAAVLIDPVDAENRWLEGCLIGVLALVLFTTKITFFAALVPVGLLRYVALGRWPEIKAALIAFLVLVAGGLLIDPMIWVGYIRDLIWVAENPLRQAPGLAFFEMLAAPDFALHSLAFVAFIALIALSIDARMAVWLLVAGGALAFVQHQNHGNMPFWILFFAVFAWAVPTRFDLSRPMQIVWVVVALSMTGLGVRLLYPMALGTIVNRFAANTDNYQPFLDGTVAMDGVFFTNANFAAETVTIVSGETPIPPFAEETECDVGAFWVGHYLAQARLMAELPGQTFVTDAMTPQWLAANLPPLQGAAPWNYGSLRGLESADFVLVPTCAVKMNYKREILRTLVREEVPLELYRQTEDAAIYRLLRDL